MNDNELFTSGTDGLVPQGDTARQAVDSLRGYVYQVTAAALAWIDLDGVSRLFLEVAEDYAVVARNAIDAVQVKDTEASGSVTLNTSSVQDAVSNFVSLKSSNPSVDVRLRYFTTSEIGTEKIINDRPGGMAGLEYWRKAATGADVEPLRSLLESDKFSAAVRKFVKDRDDETLRNEMLRKIYWDCGKPNFTALRKEFEDRLIVVGHDDFRLPAPEAARLADVLIYAVLERSIGKTPTDRVLTRADLLRVVHNATRISVPRATVDAMALLSSSFITSGLANAGAGVPVVIAEPGWLVQGNALPSARRVVRRAVIEAGIADRMRRFGASIIFGPSGVGKSSVARAVAKSLADEFVLIDFRNADATETRVRLNAMVSRIGGLRATTLIFEDLNHFSDSLVVPSLARMIEALRRRDRSIIVTCYLSPTASSISNVGLEAGCSASCPYFTETEAAELVTLHGGDASIWGRLAYSSGGFGHPQLVHAFITGMSARGWPRNEIRAIVESGLSSGDIETERDAARRALIDVIPENARELLYRLSLTIGRFDRSMALAIANVPSPIARAGECIDTLVGPWLETVGRDCYRISPLAAKSGQGMILPVEQVAIHGTIATQFMASKTVNGGDADTIMVHAMLGKNERVLLMLAHGILTADERTIKYLAENFTTFKLLHTDVPIYSDNLRISGVLRIAQFKLLVESGEADKIAKCVAALFSEAERQVKGEASRAFRAISLSVVVGTKGIANYLDNWLDLLFQFEEMIEADEILRGLRDNFEERSPGLGMVGVLVAIGSAGISSVERLEKLIDQLDGIDSKRRASYLGAIAEITPDFSVFINSPWTLEHQSNSVNGSDAAERYHRMAIKTAPWAIRALTVQCWIARAVMRDEYESDREGALEVINEAIETLGHDVLLLRARAKIYWRAHNYPQALLILREIADEVGRDNNIERAYALREAAISAAKCNEWKQAEAWFLESNRAASQLELPDMEVMAVGLGADAAVAALQIGDVKRALKGLSDALTALTSIDPTSSLRATYCHQVVRHTVLWAKSQVAKEKIKVGGEPIEIEPGCCSNPTPSEFFAKRPLGSLDLTWYMLAEAEVTSGESVGVAEGLYDRLVAGPHASMEVSLRMSRVRCDITNLDPVGFAHHLWSHVEAMAHLAKHAQRMKETFDVFNPTREDVPMLLHGNLADPIISGLVNEAVFAYVITAACKNSADSLSNLVQTLKTEFGTAASAISLVARADATAQLVPASSFEESLIDSAMLFKNDAHLTPSKFCAAGIRFYQLANRSSFKSYLVPIIATWQRNEWIRIVESESFRLVQPLRTVPRLRVALDKREDDECFLAALFLVTADAVGIMLPNEIQRTFEMVVANTASE